MPKPIKEFNPDFVRDAWDRVADTYSRGQASGRDYYRYEFFGPAQIAICGDVCGLRLLDVGCGNGYFAREMARGGASVTAIDISPRMIELATAEVLLGIDYRVMEAEKLDSSFASSAFDMVTSCVALCDMPDPATAIRAVQSVLRPGGRFVFSTTHPCTDTPFRRWERDDAGQKRWLCIDRYFDRGPYEYVWTGWEREFATPGLHVPLEDWMTWMLSAGFELRGLHEPRPTEEVLRLHPDLEDATRVPYFLIFDLIRKP